MGGAWSIGELDIRAEIGNTNYQCVADKLEAARAAIALAEGSLPVIGVADADAAVGG